MPFPVTKVRPKIAKIISAEVMSLARSKHMHGGKSLTSLTVSRFAFLKKLHHPRIQKPVLQTSQAVPNSFLTLLKVQPKLS